MESVESHDLALIPLAVVELYNLGTRRWDKRPEPTLLLFSLDS